MPENLFISDLHLAEHRPETLGLFLHFLRERPRKGDTLYVLGDLFDVWIGDDDDAALANRVRQAFREMVDRGVHLKIQHGNRDFLLGRRFAQETGAELIPDPFRLQIAGRPTLLMHGDLLCTDDLAYQKARRKLRNPVFQWVALHRSLRARRKMAADYRRRSREAQGHTAAQITDANPDTIVEYLERHQAEQLIHGHTHRPAVHQHTLASGEVATRYVLDEWHPNKASVWVDDGQQLRRESIAGE